MKRFRCNFLQIFIGIVLLLPVQVFAVNMDVTYESGSPTYVGNTDLSGFVSDTDDPLGPFSNTSVHFQGEKIGGSSQVYRYCLEFSENIKLSSIVIEGAAWHNGYIRVLDNNLNEIKRINTFGGNTFQIFEITLDNTLGTTFYLEEFNQDSDWRYRSNIRVDFSISQTSSFIFNNSEYKLTTEASSWFDAEAEAIAWGGHLVTINDQAEQDWLSLTFGTDVFWIGFNDIEEEGTWVWSSGEAVTYINWAPGEPNNSSREGEQEHVAGMNWVGDKWNDFIGYDAWPCFGIMERPIFEPVKTTTVLTANEPEYTVTADNDTLLYGTFLSNQITLESGAKAELINFPGSNSVRFESDVTLFTVSRSGTVVLFQGSDGTMLKIPATRTIQAVSFNGEENRVLQIHNNQVMLDDQVITLTPLPIDNNQVLLEGLIKSSVSYDAAPVYSGADQAALVSGFSEFSLDFYHTLRTETSKAEKNLFFSPYSIGNALAMTWAGAKNQTADQMAAALQLHLPQNQFHPTLNALNMDLNSRDDERPPSGDSFALNLVNAIWSRIGYPFVQDYLDVIAANYDAGIRTLDFMGNPDGSRQTINQWVEDQTDEKIKDLLPLGSISHLTAVVLTNAIYFKGSWYEKFDAARTAPGPFTLLDGTVVTAELMHRETDTRFYRGSSFDAVELPYASPEFLEYEYPQELAMLVIVPHPGVFESVESSLDKSGIDAIVDSLSMGTVNFTFPKFEFESETRCSDILKELGMTDAFNPISADFSGMVHPIHSEPWIDEIYHKAFVTVDEEGTEAAAATAVVMGVTMIPEVIRISADKPFIFLIYDHFTQTILFMGRVLDPTFSG